MLKTYQFKTQCKGDIHSSKTANIILTHDRMYVNTLTCTKSYSSSNACWLEQFVSPSSNIISLVHVRVFTDILSLILAK